MNKVAGVALLAIAAAVPAVHAGQAAAAVETVATGPSAIVVSMSGGKSVTLGGAELKTMPRITVKANDHGREISFEGVALSLLLERVGAPLGDALRGPALGSYVVASAPDGYQVVFALAELDPAMARNDVIVADTADGQPLAAAQGPLRIVAPADKRPARWIRMLAKVEVFRVPPAR
jgi:hypothetical protein